MYKHNYGAAHYVYATPMVRAIHMSALKNMKRFGQSQSSKFADPFQTHVVIGQPVANSCFSIATYHSRRWALALQNGTGSHPMIHPRQATLKEKENIRGVTGTLNSNVVQQTRP